MGEAKRKSLAVELAKLRQKHAKVYAREKELKTGLLAEALVLGENFKEVVAGVGTVKVSAPKDGGLTGTAPEIVVEAYLALPESRREKLEAAGIVKIAEQHKAKYYGSVTVDLF